MNSKAVARWRHSLLAGAILLLVSSVSSASIVIVDRFGPGDSFDTAHGWAVGNSTFPPDFATAFFFSSGPTGGYLDQIAIALWPLYPGVSGQGHYRASIYLDAPDVGDDVLFSPTDRIETIEFQAYNSGLPTIITLQAAGTTLLQPRTPYWLAVEPVDSSQAGWMWNNQGTLGIRAHYNSPTNPGGWIVYPNSTSAAFRITATNPVPVPAALWLLGPALGVLGVMRRRARG